MADICAAKNKKPHLTKEERFPRCYKDVSKVLKIVKSCKGNLKTVLYNSKLRGAYLKKVQGLASNILKNYRTVAEVIRRVDLSKKEPLLQLECMEVMVYELILGTGTLLGYSKPIEAMKKYQEEIQNAFQAVESEGTSDSKGSLPRYARVNTLVSTVGEVLDELCGLGYEEVPCGEGVSQERYLELVRGLRTPQFLVDQHFPDMLVFPAGENLCKLKMYQRGKILLQDKSSYIPVKTLDPEPGSAVLDACSAPGMKTIHIASMMQNQGVLLAYEKDPERFTTLQKMIHQYDIQICETFNQDFRSTDPTDERHSKVRYILLDPSCSGSGMVNRMDSATDRPDSKSESRLKKLAGFQIVLLKHALKFPNVRRVVYSTCSIHEEENEFVVHEALGAFRDRFRLVPVLPEWPTRGSGEYEFGELCLRSYPERNATNGFFVAAFERVDVSAQNSERKRSKKQRSESRVDEDERILIEGVSNSNYEDINMGNDGRKSHKKKKHETSEDSCRGGMQHHLKPEVPDSENEEFLESKRKKKKRETVEDNDGKNIRHYLEPEVPDCENEEFLESKRKKKKQRSESGVDENECHSVYGVSNSNSGDHGIGDDGHKSHKRKKHKKNRHETEGEHFEFLDCNREETSLEGKKQKKGRQKRDADERGSLEKNAVRSEPCAGSKKEGSAEHVPFCKEEKEEVMKQNTTESPDAEDSIGKKRKKHRTRGDGEKPSTRNGSADSVTSTLEGTRDSSSVEKPERKHAAENYEQSQFDGESVASTVGDSKKEKRKKHKAEIDESIVCQESRSDDKVAEETSAFKKHKKHKKNKRRSHSPKPGE